MAYLATFLVPIAFARILPPSEFGTYKQLFLIHATVYGIALGLAEALFYFLPAEPVNAGGVVANAFCMLSLGGIAGLLFLVSAAKWIGYVFNNSELGNLAPLLGLYLVLTLASAPFEIVMLARSQNRRAAATYAVSDILRASLLVLPVLFFRGVRSLLAGSIVFAVVRLIVMLVYVRHEFGPTLKPDTSCLRRQLAYSIPLQAAVALQVLQLNLHQYVVSMKFDAAAFARYSVGCMQIPIFEVIAGSVCSIMMVRMGEQLRDGKYDAVSRMWADTTRNLALLFFPATVFLFISCSDLITFLFTDAYKWSIPIFSIWVFSFFLAGFQPHAVLRVYGDTRFLAVQNLAKLILVAILIYPLTSIYGMVGAVAVAVGAIFAGKCMLLIRLQHLLRAPLSGILPWRHLLAIAAMSITAAIPAIVLRYTVPSKAFINLLSTGGAYTAAYAVLYFLFIRRQVCGDLFGLTKSIPRWWSVTTAGKA